MSGSVQEFIATITERTGANLLAALERLPEDRRGWSPLGKGRTALDQAAECAIVNRVTAQVLAEFAFPEDFLAVYEAERTRLAADWNAVRAQLEGNTASVAAAIRAVRSDDLTRQTEMPWGPLTVATIMVYPYWNMSYHEGQVNYIASLV